MVNKFTVVSEAVEIANTSIVAINDALIDRIIKRAQQAPQRRARVLLHPDKDNSLHEMLIALPRESCDIPHINYKSGKSFHVVYGDLVLMVFNEIGSKVTPCRLKANDANFNRMVRLNSPYWHTIIPLSDYVVFIETIIGPFTGNYFADWSPKDLSQESGVHFYNTLNHMANNTQHEIEEKEFIVG